MKLSRRQIDVLTQLPCRARGLSCSSCPDIYSEYCILHVYTVSSHFVLNKLPFSITYFASSAHEVPTLSIPPDYRRYSLITTVHFVPTAVHKRRVIGSHIQTVQCSTNLTAVLFPGGNGNLISCRNFCWERFVLYIPPNPLLPSFVRLPLLQHHYLKRHQGHDRSPYYSERYPGHQISELS